MQPELAMEYAIKIFIETFVPGDPSNCIGQLVTWITENMQTEDDLEVRIILTWLSLSHLICIYH